MLIPRVLQRPKLSNQAQLGKQRLRPLHALRRQTRTARRVAACPCSARAGLFLPLLPADQQAHVAGPPPLGLLAATAHGSCPLLCVWPRWQWLGAEELAGTRGDAACSGASVSGESGRCLPEPQVSAFSKRPPHVHRLAWCTASHLPYCLALPLGPQPLRAAPSPPPHTHTCEHHAREGGPQALHAVGQLPARRGVSKQQADSGRHVPGAQAQPGAARLRRGPAACSGAGPEPIGTTRKGGAPSAPAIDASMAVGRHWQGKLQGTRLRAAKQPLTSGGILSCKRTQPTPRQPAQQHCAGEGARATLMRCHSVADPGCWLPVWAQRVHSQQPGGGKAGASLASRPTAPGWQCSSGASARTRVVLCPQPTPARPTRCALPLCLRGVQLHSRPGLHAKQAAPAAADHQRSCAG